MSDSRQEIPDPSPTRLDGANKSIRAGEASSDLSNMGAEIGAKVSLALREYFRSMRELEESESRMKRVQRVVQGWIRWKSGPLALILSVLLWLRLLFPGVHL